jgi:hypothetical protein
MKLSNNSSYTVLKSPLASLIKAFESKNWTSLTQEEINVLVNKNYISQMTAIRFLIRDSNVS